MASYLHTLFLISLLFSLNSTLTSEADNNAAVEDTAQPGSPEAIRLELDKLISKLHSLESLVNKKNQELKSKDEMVAQKEKETAQEEFFTALKRITMAQAGHALSSDVSNYGDDSESLKPPLMDDLEGLLAVSDPSTATTSIIDGLQKLYTEKLKPLEGTFDPSTASTSIIDGLQKLYTEKLKPLDVTFDPSAVSTSIIDGLQKLYTEKLKPLEGTFDPSAASKSIIDGLQKLYTEKLKPLDVTFDPSAASTSIIDGLKKLYNEKLKPIEVTFDPSTASTSIIDGLKKLYTEKLKPLEVTYKFKDFISPLMTNADFDAKPMVMLLGQYSTGKTTFIKHLLKSSYPGAHIGPEPTTDRFVVVMNGPDERRIPGNTVTVQADMPYSALTKFGSEFLSKFECSQMPHPLLEHITFVDTPGVLSGEKQRTKRSYDFTGVTSWFATNCDLILLLFDPHKLDISDEFKRVISSLRGNDDKIRLVLNKADQIDTQQLMRVYGALMWSLGKVLNTPEVKRVYIGSFSDKPASSVTAGPIGTELFKKEQEDLLNDLGDIHKMAIYRKINELVKRANAVKIHTLIVSHLKKEMPILIGKAQAQHKLIDNLEDVFAKVQREHNLPVGDMPCVESYRERLRVFNLDQFEKLKPEMIEAVDKLLGYDIPNLLRKFQEPI